MQDECSIFQLPFPLSLSLRPLCPLLLPCFSFSSYLSQLSPSRPCADGCQGSSWFEAVPCDQVMMLGLASPGKC